MQFWLNFLILEISKQKEEGKMSELLRYVSIF
jgi:hypothetical protein